MPAPNEVIELVERFGLHLDDYRNGRYTETQLRRDYLDPFFKALGWDVDNSQGLAEAYRDVIHEDIVRVGGYTKAPDYSFRQGRDRAHPLLEVHGVYRKVGRDRRPILQGRGTQGGSFDKYAAATKGKKGTAEVDAAFFDEIESWREMLIKNIALRNPELSQPALNYAVQQTIDHIVFLRIGEDRGIEPYG